MSVSKFPGLLFVSEELGDLQNMIDAFAKHAKSVYELEMFYGDETLKGMIEHGQELVKVLAEIDFVLNEFPIAIDRIRKV